jgi:hypothetical protein
VVEHRLAKARVASSNLVSRSNLRSEGKRKKEIQSFAFFLLPFAFCLCRSAFFLYAHRWRRSQVVRQRSAKPLFIGSIPIAASINSKSDNGLQADSVWCSATSRVSSSPGMSPNHLL